MALEKKKKKTFEKLSTSIFIKDKHNKVCVVCVKHDNKVHFFLTVVKRVRGGVGQLAVHEKKARKRT